jgi:hydroxyethylthiazole kinase-like uncharacterized protein yjeF
VNALPICSTQAIRGVEERARPAPLMERAGAAAAGQARLLAPSTARRVAVFAGPGNNGGDAYVVARHLSQWGYRVDLIQDEGATRMPPDAAAARAQWRAAGGTACADPPPLQEHGLIIDGLFGIGLKRPLAGRHAEWIAAINRAGCPVLALDVPSGLDADTGACAGPTVRATHTATFLALKPGLLTGPGVDVAGIVTLHDLAVDARAGDGEAGDFVTWAVARHWLRPRARNSHKGTFGTVGLLGGAEGMCGAPLLAGRAALMAGAGKIQLGLLAAQAPALDAGQPELMLRGADEVLRGDATTLVVGPGLGQSRAAADCLGRALSRPVPLVIDADGLNVLALEPGLAQRLKNRAQPTLLTPHPAEAARLLQTGTASIQADRVAAVRQLVATFGTGVALKGAGTVCAFPDGSWAINGSGNPGLASGGSGDVLAGILGALLAQGYPAWRALTVGVCVHGMAADVLVREGTGPSGMAASELAPVVRRLLNG